VSEQVGSSSVHSRHAPLHTLRAEQRKVGSHEIGRTESVPFTSPQMGKGHARKLPTEEVSPTQPVSDRHRSIGHFPTWVDSYGS
jgi:hypothetical protein